MCKAIFGYIDYRWIEVRGGDKGTFSTEIGTTERFKLKSTWTGSQVTTSTVFYSSK